MLLRWYRMLFVGSFLINLIYGQDNEPEARVILTIDTRPRSSIDAKNSFEPFTCYECLNCQQKSNLTTRICQPGVNMCFITRKRIDNTDRIIRRGCSTARGQCVAPIGDQLNSFDSVTCCTSQKCNQGIPVRPWMILLISYLFLTMIRIHY